MKWISPTHNWVLCKPGIIFECFKVDSMTQRIEKHHNWCKQPLRILQNVLLFEEFILAKQLVSNRKNCRDSCSEGFQISRMSLVLASVLDIQFEELKLLENPTPKILG